MLFEDGKGGWVANGMAGTWECEEELVGEGDATQVQWVFKAKDGTVRRKETVSLSQRSVPHTDRFTALLEGLNRPAAPALVEPTEEEPIVDDSEVVELLEANAEEGEAPQPKRLRSLSPPRYIPSAPRTLLYNEEDTFALLESTLAEEELAASRQEEKEAHLKVLQGLLKDEAAAAAAAVTEVKVGRPKPMVEGFADDDDDDDLADVLRLRGGAGELFEEAGEVLRLRGGAAESSDDSSDSDDDDEDVAMAEDAPKPKTTLAMGSLKDMFTPKEAEGTPPIITTSRLRPLTCSSLQAASPSSPASTSSSNPSSAPPRPLLCPFTASPPPPPPAPALTLLALSYLPSPSAAPTAPGSVPVPSLPSSPSRAESSRTPRAMSCRMRRPSWGSTKQPWRP